MFAPSPFSVSCSPLASACDFRMSFDFISGRTGFRHDFASCLFIPSRLSLSCLVSTDLFVCSPGRYLFSFLFPYLLLIPLLVVLTRASGCSSLFLSGLLRLLILFWIFIFDLMSPISFRSWVALPCIVMCLIYTSLLLLIFLCLPFDSACDLLVFLFSMCLGY